MQRTLIAALVSVLVLGACTQEPQTGPAAEDSPSSVQPIRPGSVAACVPHTFEELEALVRATFVNGSPDANSALGKLSNIRHQLSLGATVVARDKAWDLVQFILQKKRQGALVATDAKILELINGILCFVGLPPLVTDVNGWIVFPSDQPQTLVTTDGLAGTVLPANPVTEPTFIGITPLPASPAPLITKLDKYPLYFTFTKASETNAPFTKNVTVGVCSASGIDQAIANRLRLGHQTVNGFVITPPADASFLNCTNAPPATSSQAAVPGWIRTLARLVVPGPLHATALFGGGVGGSVGEFSPFGPVDPQLSATGGVGGSVGEFAPPQGFAALAGCNPVEAPIGTPVPDACRPAVTVSTHLGTQLENVPVTFSVLAGGGVVAPEVLAACGAFGAASTVPTSASGVSRACWTLGSLPGTNTVRAVAGNGGDAVTGTFFTYQSGAGGPPASGFIEFTATANPADSLQFSQYPASATAGNSFEVRVQVIDRNGVVVLGSGDQVTLSLSSGSFATGTTVASAVNGVATFSGLSITAAGTYTITASATLHGNARSATGPSFTVGAAAPTAIAIVAGDNQTVPAGTAVPIAPSARVRDGFGNVVPGTTITFAAQNNGAIVTGATPVTNASGIATVGSWTLVDGPNQLIASITPLPPAPAVGFVTFSATGTTTLDALNVCEPGGSGDPLIYPFYAPLVAQGGGNRTLRQVELYLSSNGAANVPVTYRIALHTRLNSFGNPIEATSIVNVTLTGRASEFLPTSFRFPAPLPVSNRDVLAFQFEVLNNPDGASLAYNTGPCGLGNCKPPKGCVATQATGVAPLPLGKVRRGSVGFRLLGN